MDRLLNIGFIAAAFALCVSMTDFFLKPKQKEAIEAYLDALTLRLDYVKTVFWLRRWLKATERAELAFRVIRWLGVLGVPGCISFAVYFGWQGDWPWWGTVLFSLLMLFGWLICWLVIIRSFIKYGEPVIQLLSESESLANLVYGYCGVVFGGVALFGAFLFFAQSLPANFYLKYGGFINHFGGVFICCLFIAWIFVIVDGVLILVGAFCILLARLLLGLARWIMWRISEFPKGPLAAVLTLLGVVLGILKIVLAK